MLGCLSFSLFFSLYPLLCFQMCSRIVFNSGIVRFSWEVMIYFSFNVVYLCPCFVEFQLDDNRLHYVIILISIQLAQLSKRCLGDAQVLGDLDRLSRRLRRHVQVSRLGPCLRSPRVDAQASCCCSLHYCSCSCSLYVNI